jgi:hypothetical protein
MTDLEGLLRDRAVPTTDDAVLLRDREVATTDLDGLLRDLAVVDTTRVMRVRAPCAGVTRTARLSTDRAGG